MDEKASELKVQEDEVMALIGASNVRDVPADEQLEVDKR
jgi:hypothetical protein